MYTRQQLSLADWIFVLWLWPRLSDMFVLLRLCCFYSYIFSLHIRMPCGYKKKCCCHVFACDWNSLADSIGIYVCVCVCVFNLICLSICLPVCLPFMHTHICTATLPYKYAEYAYFIARELNFYTHIYILIYICIHTLHFVHLCGGLFVWHSCKMNESVL